MIMKKLLLATAFACLAIVLKAQTADDYRQSYERLVARVGYGGVGVETLLDKWEKADSAGIEVPLARARCHFARSRTDSVKVHNGRKYLDMDPVLVLKDTLNRPVYYFNEPFFDETEYGLGLKVVDNVIAANPLRLDLCVFKANALLEYEKESPDLTLQFLLELINRNFKSSPSWEYPGETVDKTFFCDMVQSYCFSFYRIGSASSKEAFRVLSETMLKYDKNNSAFLDNVGTYHLVVRKNEKQALKYYRKSLKADPGDETARKNIALIEKRAAAGK